MTRLQKGDKKEFDSDEEDIDVSYSSAGEQGEEEFDEESDDVSKENKTGQFSDSQAEEDFFSDDEELENVKLGN